MSALSFTKAPRRPQAPRRTRPRLWWVLPLGAWLLLATGAAAWAAGPDHDALRKRLAGLVDRGTIMVAGANGEAAFVLGDPHAPWRPASILKIATALTALEGLGADYRFPTEFYLDDARRLIIRGFGDPFLISEEWRAIAETLAAQGVFDRPLGGLVLDDSAFPPLRVDGAGRSDNPYDAVVAPLVSNFNTVNVAVAPGGSVTSAEPQTPLTALARELGRGLPAGVHRVNLSLEPGNTLRYTGELVRAIFADVGASMPPDVRRGTVPPGAALVLAHHSSRRLPEVVQAMLKYSNNVIANQLLLTQDLARHGPPAELARAARAATMQLRDWTAEADSRVTMTEGSGISRGNRVSAAAMLGLLERFRPWRHLLSEYVSDGHAAPAKTGNLRGVYTLAGYLPTRDGEGRPFVILLNQRRNTRAAVFRTLHRAFGE